MKASHSLLISCLLVVAVGHSVAASNPHRRQEDSQSSVSPPPTIIPSPSVSIPSPSPPPESPSPSSPPPPQSSPTPEPSPEPQPSPQPSPSPSPPPPSETSTPVETVTTPPAPQTPTSTISTPPPTELTVSTDSAGIEVTVTVTNPPTQTSETASATSTKDSDNESSGISTGSIIGMSVAGGVALLSIIAFFVWKFSKKRRDDFDDSEAIKWPDLNTHGGNADSHPLPVHNTGRAGFDTGSEVSLSRAPSNYSTPDISGGGHDPYAVPPLPHMNPNQPYRDDPTATGYYDPYRGPVPGTLEHGPAATDDWAGEAIPMTQMANPHAGRMSPGPQAAYGGDYDPDRRSPGPQAAYGRTSPGPQVAYGGGRVSPGPQVAYGGRASPGTNTAYAAGRVSPGPQAAYDPYGAR